MSHQLINPTGCEKCGGRRWEYFDFCPVDRVEIIELRCLEINCGHQDLTYGDEYSIHKKSPEEVQEFIEEYDLQEEMN
tara:strand:+ start:291 stop:524 length:234 start_codon:yes stop_codon:yes gene_type:complete